MKRTAIALTLMALATGSAHAGVPVPYCPAGWIQKATGGLVVWACPLDYIETAARPANAAPASTQRAVISGQGNRERERRQNGAASTPDRKRAKEKLWEPTGGGIMIPMPAENAVAPD